MRLSFHGGAREVTGACYLLETASANILVDCGFFQGCDECADLNFRDFGFDPKSVKALLVTHAHLDHVGRIPKLVRAGFRGEIYSTAPTKDLARLILEDALALAKRENEQLYSTEDIEATFDQWRTLPYDEDEMIGDVSFRFENAGHILGSSFVRIQAEGKRILFTGDIGNTPSTLLPPPDIEKGAEYLIMESTYGNRTHEPPSERGLKLERAVEDTASRGGTLLIPAFATERTQDILFLLNEMLHVKRIPQIPVFVDAPLAIRITEVYEKYLGDYRQEIRDLLHEHPNLFRFKNLRFTAAVEDSKRINEVPQPKVIIAGSGMMNGGRVLHHARRYLPDHKSILLIIGFQSAGSLGRRLLDKAKIVRIFGEEVTVEAEIRQIGGFSAHADNPQLFALVDRMRDSLKRVFIVHGEAAQAMHMTQEIRDRLGLQADAPLLHDSFEL